MRRFISSGLVACLLTFMSASPLHAQTSSLEKPKPVAQTKAHFSQSDAAHCAAVYGWVMNFLAPNGLNAAQAYQSEVAFMIWQYEMVAATPENKRNDATLKAVAQLAMNNLNAQMPVVKEGEKPDIAIQHVLKQENQCSDKLRTAYPNNNHPVILQLRAAAEKTQNMAPKKVDKAKLKAKLRD